MICAECKKEVDDDVKLLAYTANGKPVYWEICKECLHNRWKAFNAINSGDSDE